MRTILLSVILAMPPACRSSPPAAPADARWLDELTAFRAERATSIGGEDGWLTLVARAWLVEGANSIGAQPDATAALPTDRAPALVGNITLTHGVLRFTAAAGVDVAADGKTVTAIEMHDDANGKPTVLEHGSLKMHVIKRGDRWALRVKDSKHPALTHWKGLDWFPPDPKWRIRARLEKAAPGTVLPIDTVIHTTEQKPSAGRVVFTIDGVTYKMEALTEDGEPGLFVIFKDKTAGKTSYPPGRFINTPAVEADGSVELDFNRAYSPPCAFTEFATCPLPPKENHLPFEIAAGEKYEGRH